jgi:SPP1 family predicted phage head-tail adaptor
MADNRAGQLRHIITIRRQTKTRDGRGGFVTSWSTIGTARAKVEGLAGREAVVAQALQGISAFRIRIRFRADLLQSDQITLSSGMELNIKSIGDPDGLNRWQVLLADNESVAKDL